MGWSRSYSYRTKSDLLDGKGKMYDFSKVDSTGNQTKALKLHTMR
jgi:hypothetical protein